MRKILIEIGFDWSAGNLSPALEDEQGSLLRSDPPALYPLQHGFVRLEHGEGLPMWGTQIEAGDRVRFRFFNIDRHLREEGDPRPEPVLFHAYFQDSENPETARDVLPEVPAPLVAGDGAPFALTPSLGLGHSHVFGAPERQSGIARTFDAWDLVGPHGEPPWFEVGPKRRGLLLDRALMALALRVRRGELVRDFVLDPEVYVGPYGDDTSRELPSGRSLASPEVVERCTTN